MKKILAVSLLLVFPLSFVPFGSASIEAQNPLQGKIIALDAGHGGDDYGAVNQNYGVKEKDVNLAVVYALKEKLAGACVVLTRVGDETIINRKDRVDLAIEKCKSECGSKCDVLVSVHHNGSTDSTHDGTMVIYNEKQDIPLAKALLETLVPLTENNEGLDHGGYGMTVYGHLVSALTEAYYITNDWEAEQYYYSIDTDGNGIIDRIEQEADALYQGLVNYFSSSSGNGGGKPEKCSPWPECRNK